MNLLRSILFHFILLITFHSSIAQKTETIYLSPGDSTSNLYIIVYPQKLPWKGFAFFIPGMFQKASDVLVQTDLPLIAAHQGIVAIIPTFRTGIGSFGFDTATQASFIDMLDHVITKYQLGGLKFYAGGFSIGGTCAIKYAELALKNNYKIKPAAVFAIDSPLDIERFYHMIQREKRLISDGSPPQEEGEYIMKRILKEFGGTPMEMQQKYFEASPYSFNDTTQRAIKPLVKLPLRLYTEPDIAFWLADGADYSGMNAFDLAALTNELKRLGNKNAELITTYKKGIRKPANTPHPHSWSIVESKDLVDWMLMQQ